MVAVTTPSGRGSVELLTTCNIVVGLVELNVHHLRRVHDGEERRLGLEIVVVELPDEAGLRGIAHPGNDGRGGMEELRVASFVHGAEGFVVGQLRLAHEVGEVGGSCRSARRSMPG